jgi:AcrR family transcriptional regulator
MSRDPDGAEMEHTRSEDRSLATQQRLVDVTIRILAESGHARATIQRICGVAGVSNGGVFRHFSSRDELLVRVGYELANRIQEAFVFGRQSNFDHVEGEHPLLPLLRETRRVSRSETGLAWREILLAARYSDRLVESLRPAIERMRSKTLQYACDLTGLPATHPAAHRLAMVFMNAAHMFNSEACFDFHPSSEGDELRLAWMAETLAIEVARAVANFQPAATRKG